MRICENSERKLFLSIADAITKMCGGDCGLLCRFVTNESRANGTFATCLCGKVFFSPYGESKQFPVGEEAWTNWLRGIFDRPTGFFHEKCVANAQIETEGSTVRRWVQAPHTCLNSIHGPV